MATYQITAPDGNKYRLTGPDNASQQDLINALLAQNPEAGQPPAPPQEGIMAALTGGAKRFGSTLETGLESFIDPNLAAKRGAERKEEIGQQYAPGASLEKVKQAYEQKGLFPAAYEAISQIPSAVAEQAPNIAASLGGARAGAMVGSPFGPVGAVVGGVGGAFVPSLMQLYGSGLERQAEEKAPEISRAKALGAAIPGAAAEVASTFIPLGRNLVGKLLGPQAEKALARGTNESIEAAAKESLAASLTKGAGVGALTEIPTEVGQQMLERLQAGLSITTPDALAEYGEAAYGAGLVGSPFGAAARGLGRPAAKEAYTNLLQEEQAKEDIELDKRAAAAAREEREQIQRTQSQLGVPVEGENVSNVLMLPAPSKTYEEPKDLLQDPVGRVTEDELGKAIGDNSVVNYLNKYRKENSLPKLKSYSIEDVKDAMTAQNPEGEEGALNSILAYKTNYQNETYTPDDINNVAVAKNVATDTKGFSDFLTRATGKSDLNTMTQPELHSVAKALEALPRTGTEAQLVLPEGSNATRFTQDQYNQGVTTALMGVKQGKPISLDQARNAIKAQTDLKTDRDADSMLKIAASNEDLIIERGTGFQATNKTGDILGTYGTEAEAKRNHRRADIAPVETQLIRAPEEIRTEKTAQLPEGYGIEKTAEAGDERPAAYVVRAEGSQKNESQTFAEEVDAKDRLTSLARGREANAKAKEAAADRIRQDLEKEQAKIVQMEADGLTGTSEHTKAVNAFKAANVTKSAQITSYLDEAEAFRAPLKIVPLGKKTTKVEKHTVIRGGKKLGTFPNKTEAEKSILAQATDAELQTIADRGGVFGKRAETELGERKRTTPGIKVKGTAEGLEKAGVRTPETEAKLKELEAKLTPILKKFGLEDVGLNVVRAISNDAEGSFKGAEKLIQIAFNATNPIKTMRHEALHALKELGFFTPQQWKALEKQAKDKWIGQYLENVKFDADTSRLQAYRNLGLTEDEIIEEAIADAFGDFEAAGKAPPGMLQALFKRLQQFFAALRQALTGAGFESAEDIFGKIERGELKAGKQAGGTETKASLKNTTKGLLNPNIPPKFEKIIDDVVKEMDLTPEEFASTSLIHQTGKAGTEQFESDKIGGLPEVVQFLQEQRRKSGLPLLDTEKPADRKMIAKLMATEAMAAIRSGGANLEWYDSIINKTLAMAGLKYPELNTDINARMAFRIATAITSQGLNVEDNLAFAMKVYDQFRQNGKFPEIGQGADQSAMASNFKLANYLMDDMGADMMRQFLETEFTVEEMRGAGFNIAGELGDEKVLGSSVFGPKIGFGFYSNLNGNFDPVTMDMWFMRTIGRLTGKLRSFRQDLYDAQLEKFRSELNTEGSNGVFANQFDQNEVELAKVDDKAAEALARKVKSAHERDYKTNRASFDDGTREKSKLVAVSETMIKSLDSPRDAPANGSERRNLRDIVRQMVDIVEEKYGKRVPPASLQAVIWYPEQELYKAMGVKLRVTSQNYAGAIEKILKGEGYGESNLSAAAKLGSRTAQQLAKSAVAKGSKAAGTQPVRLGALQAEEKEALLERGRKRIVLEEEKETPKRKRVIFEVAPDPNNEALTNKWRSLPNEVRIKISEKIGNIIIKSALTEFGLKGYVDTQVGSYLDDTNPSFALYLDSGDSVAMAKFLGYVLSQDSMMVVSPKAGKGLDKTGAVRVNIGDAPASKVDKIYQQLREIEVDGEKPVGGQSYMNGHMVVLNYSNVPTDQLAKLINDKLEDNYDVITEDVYTSFPEKKDYDYANPSSDPRGNAGVLRQAGRDLRTEATRLLEKELKQFKPEASASAEEKLSLRTYFPTAEEAENAAYEKAPPATAEFKRFFGGSTVKEEGRPQVMYHGSTDIFDSFNESKPIFVTPNAVFAEDFAESRAKDLGRDPKDLKVYPLWVRAETPFDYENAEHVAQVIDKIIAEQNLKTNDSVVRLKQSTPKVSTFRKEVAGGLWSVIEDPVFQDALKTLGFDSFNVKEGGNKNLAVFTANQVKSVTGNIGDFGENKNIKYSLKPVSADVDAAIDRTTVAREEKGFIGRILEAIFPKSAGHFRQQALNRYNQLGVYDKMLAEKMGGAAFLADQSAESAALMSDLSASVTASAFGYGNRTGGVPVYRNGLTTIDTSVKGPIAILAPLARYNNPRIYQRYQFWAGVKRGKRFMADGKEKNFEQADIARAAQLEKEHPEFVQIQKEMNEFNNGLVKYMVQTGVIDSAKAQIYMQHADYIPFYRQMDGERTIGPNIFQSISGVKPPKALKGGEAPLADYLETIVRNTQAAIQSGMKNTAAQRAVGVAEKIGMAQRLNKQDSGPDTVQVMEKGERVSYRVADPLFIDACRSLNLPDLPFMGLLAAPADILRNLVTKDPGFMLANMMRDSLSSWITSGANITPIIGTMSGFSKALSGKSASMEALLNAGILGGYEFSSGVLKSGEVLAADMNKKYGKATGAKVFLKPFTSLWDALEKGTEASDAATRIAIYERVLADTGNEAEAIFRSLEVMNFNRKGSSAIIRIATAAIPFLNARMQGLDIFYRTAFGRDTDANAAMKQKAFFVRGATLMALSVALFTMVSDDDEYKKQEEETKDNYWIIPGVGKFPVPFEVGFLFKTVPERIYAAMFKDDTGEDLKESMKRGITSTLAFNPMPQTFKPIAEAMVNYNSFTGRVIVGAGMEGRSPEFQVGPSTSEVAKQLGSALGLSPLKIDHILQGYTGTIGMYLVQVTDSVLNANDNSPNASKRFEQLPIIKRFALDPEARGNITQFYALKNATDQAVTTLNFLERSGDAEAYAKYFEENAGLLANKNYVNSIEKQMKKYREMRAMVQAAEMTGDEKRDLLIDIGRAENDLNQNIKEVKKIIKEVQ